MPRSVCAKTCVGKTAEVSQLVSDYFALIEADEPIPGTELTPRVRAMIGSLKGASTTEDDYRRYLEEKHR